MLPTNLLIFTFIGIDLLLYYSIQNWSNPMILPYLSLKDESQVVATELYGESMTPRDQQR